MATLTIPANDTRYVRSDGLWFADVLRFGTTSRTTTLRISGVTPYSHPRTDFPLGVYSFGASGADAIPSVETQRMAFDAYKLENVTDTACTLDVGSHLTDDARPVLFNPHQHDELITAIQALADSAIVQQVSGAATQAGVTTVGYTAETMFNQGGFRVFSDAFTTPSGLTLCVMRFYWRALARNLVFTPPTPVAERRFLIGGGKRITTSIGPRTPFFPTSSKIVGRPNISGSVSFSMTHGTVPTPGSAYVQEIFYPILGLEFYSTKSSNGCDFTFTASRATTVQTDLSNYRMVAVDIEARWLLDAGGSPTSQSFPGTGQSSFADNVFGIIT